MSFPINTPEGVVEAVEKRASVTGDVVVDANGQEYVRHPVDSTLMVKVEDEESEALVAEIGDAGLVNDDEPVDPVADPVEAELVAEPVAEAPAEPVAE